MHRIRFAVSLRYALVFLSLLILVAAGGIFRYSRAMADTHVGNAGSMPSGGDVLSDDGQSGSSILLGLARDAMRDGRLVAPAGSNAWEFYLSVLELQPQDRIAQDALRESLPRAALEIERNINRKDLDEARRELDLLRDFDRDNFTLALLGGKLSAARNILMQQHEAQAERIRQAQTGRGAAM